MDGRFWVVSFLLVVFSGLSLASEEAKWWLQPQRLLQTNLREIDATMDLDRYIQEVKDFGANVVLFNVGGIVANYPTELKYHWRNRHMKGDLVGTVLDRLHKEGIRMIGRFDFSKINEEFAAEHPEWLYVSVKGETVNYNGQVHTCVSGGYQQEYLFNILGEAVDRYPLDGVFFNMIGYTRSDYSGNYHGICQCQNCKRLFKEFCGLELPQREDSSVPSYSKYRQWTGRMTDRQFTRVHDFLKAKSPGLAICTYTLAGIDIIRKESNRPLGQGTYSDTEKAKGTLLTCGERQLACCAVHFIDIPYRHAAVSPYLTARRLWQQMAGGAWLDFYCIGPLQRQEDRTGLDLAAGIYNFHAANEKWLKFTSGAGEVGLVHRGEKEYEGILQILSEHQVAYELSTMDPERLRKFPVLVIPDAGGLSSGQCAALDKYVEDGGKLLLTAGIPAALKCSGSVTRKAVRPREKGAYIRIRPEDRKRLKRPLLEKLDLVFLAGPFTVYDLQGDVEGLLRLIPQDMFGPPEKCYYRKVSDHPALIYNRYGKGAVACFPFDIGRHYEEQCHGGHANLVMGAIDNLLEVDRRLRVATSPLVEVTHRSGKNGRYEWIGLYNHTGQRDKVVHRPVPIPGIQIDLKPLQDVRSVRLLKSGKILEFKKLEDGKIRVVVPQLDHYEVVLFEYN